MAGAVLLHPHPDMGGNQHNNVIAALYEHLGAAGVTADRFDFASAAIDSARAQAIAAIEAMTAAPVYLFGYSFGGGVAATVDHPAVAGWCLVAPALAVATPVIGPDPRPKYVIAGGRDAWFGPEQLATATADWVATEHAVVPGADHFFAGADTDRVAELAVRWLAGRSG